jgi:hypothetical protein
MQLRKIIEKHTKKGDIFQIFYVLIIIIIMAILALIVGKLSYSFTEAFKDPSLHLSDSPAGQESNDLIQTMSIPLMDFFIFMFFLGSNIGIFIGAIKTKYSPVMMFLFILLLLIEILVASGAVNIYQGFHDETSLDPVPSKMYLTNLLLSKFFPLIISVIGGVVLIIMYSKSGSDTNF